LADTVQTDQTPGQTGKLVSAWRITSKAYSAQTDAFSGFGAAHYPGRWNRLGVPVVYCCSSIALCALEVLVHTKSTKTLENRFVTFEVRIVADIIFPPQQAKDLHKLEQTREIGQQWITDAQFAVMRVPSIITRESNYIVNPLHPDFKSIEIDPAKPFKFDLRATSKEIALARSYD
jgi:RES domain-containing protein